MGIKCLFGTHTWSGCKCSKCGKLRDEGHLWAGDKCHVCGKQRPDVVLRCEHCGAEYALGKDTMCITSDELSGMFAAVMGSMPQSLMVGRAGHDNQSTLLRDRTTILRLGPSRGWECGQCHHHNRWTAE